MEKFWGIKYTYETPITEARDGADAGKARAVDCTVVGRLEANRTQPGALGCLTNRRFNNAIACPKLFDTDGG